MKILVRINVYSIAESNTASFHTSTLRYVASSFDLLRVHSSLHPLVSQGTEPIQTYNRGLFINKFKPKLLNMLKVRVKFSSNPNNAKKCGWKYYLVEPKFEQQNITQKEVTNQDFYLSQFGYKVRRVLESFSPEKNFILIKRSSRKDALMTPIQTGFLRPFFGEV